MGENRERNRLGLIVSLCALALVAGCGSPRKSLNDEYIIYPSYWGRHLTKICDDCHKFRIDVDRTVFGLEDIPVEQQ